MKPMMIISGDAFTPQRFWSRHITTDPTVIKDAKKLGSGSYVRELTEEELKQWERDMGERV